MNNWQNEAYGPVGPRLGKIEVIAVTDTSVVVDLSARTNIYADLQAGRLLLADADGAAVYFAFNSENGGTIDDTNSTAANATQCMRIPANALVTLRPPIQIQAEVNGSAGAITVAGMNRYLLVKCASGQSAKLRLAIVSESTNKRLS